MYLLKSAKNGFLNRAIHHLAANINNAHWVRAGSERQLETKVKLGEKNLLIALVQFLFLLPIWLMMRLIMMRIRIGTALERWGMHLTCAEGFLSFCEVDSKLYFKVWYLLLYMYNQENIHHSSHLIKSQRYTALSNNDERAMSHGSLSHILYPGHDK